MKPLSGLLAACVLSIATTAANAVILTYDLTAPDNGLQATFVFNETGTLDGQLIASDLVSITGDFGDGVFSYTFNSTTSNHCGVYDTADLSLLRWTCGGSQLLSTNASSSGVLG